MYAEFLLLCMAHLALGQSNPSKGRCGVNEKPMKLKILEPNTNNPANPLISFVPLEVYYDFTNFDTTSVDPDYISHIKEVLEKAKLLFKTILRGVKNEGNLIIKEKYCFNETIKFSDSVQTVGVDANIVILPFFDPEMPEGVLAYAGTCVVLGWPQAGLLGLNPKLTTYKDSNAIYESLSIVMHEMTHVLVFAAPLYPLFRDEFFMPRKPETITTTRIINGVNRTFITTPKVVETARKHFGCNDLIGVEVENQGGEGTAGSHWEARVMLGDYMIGSIMDEMVISDITLALFEDSGWYKVNYYTGGLFRFGKNEGCAFLNQRCIQNRKTAFKRAFCDVRAQPFCSNGRSSRGVCSINYYDNIPKEYQYFYSTTLGGYPFADYCPVSTSNTNKVKGENCQLGELAYKDYGEVISKTSLCFISSLSPKNMAETSEKSICYPVDCDFATKTTTVTVLGTKITCPPSGGLKEVETFTGYIKCPVFTDVCTTNTRCTDIEDCISKQSELIDSEIITPTDSACKLITHRLLIALCVLILVL